MFEHHMLVILSSSEWDGLVQETFCKKISFPTGVKEIIDGKVSIKIDRTYWDNNEKELIAEGHTTYYGLNNRHILRVDMLDHGWEKI